MEFKQHVDVMRRTEVSLMHDVDPRLLHGIIGLASELGEIGEIIAKADGNISKMDESNLAEEIGDMIWYVSLCVDALGIDYDVVTAHEEVKRGSREFFIKYFTNLSVAIGRLVDTMKCKIYYNRGYLKEHIVDELTAIIYEIGGMAKYTPFTLEVIMDMNNAKLKTRYPSKFNNYMANSRDLLQEKMAMINAAAENKPTTKNVTE